MSTKRINLWSSPRNLSTAMMYSFAQREDTRVVDEPLYAHYLLNIPTEAEHPGREEVLASQLNDGQQVVDQVLLGEYEEPVVVFKQMTHHLIELDRSFLRKMDNVLLIRDPLDIIASYSKVITNPTITDIGIGMQYELCRQLEAMGRLTAVVDIRQLLRHPEEVLRILCEEKLGIPFDPRVLSWEAGPRPEDGVWAKYWYKNVHHSTGFQAYQEKVHHLSLRQHVLAEECRPYYEYLMYHAIIVSE